MKKNIFIFYFKSLLLFLTGSLLCLSIKAQFTATWALNATTNKTATLTGAQSANVIVGDMIPGASVSGGTHNTDGYACKSTTSWPTIPINGFNLDFPISPNGNNIINLSSFRCKVKTSGSSGFNTLGLAYQTDGAGAWNFFGTPIDINTGGSSLDTSIAFPSLSLPCNHTYIIRIYIYATVTAPTSSRTVYIGNIIQSGNTTNCITSIPTITTISPSSITCLTAMSGGNITNNGGAVVTSSGICWSTSPNPTTSNNINSNGTNTGTYPSALNGLQPSTTYYVRAYAINSAGTAYGNEYSFTTPPPTPTLISNVNSLNFGTDTVNNCSTPLSFLLSGIYLNPADSLITITAPFGFRVSTSANGPFYPYIQIPYSGSTLPSTTIYIRFCPTQTRNYSDSVRSNTLGSLNNYIQVLGTGVDDPTTLQTISGLSNRGKEFWTGYGSTEYMYDSTGAKYNLQDLQFTFSNSNNVPASVTVSIPRLGFLFNVSVPANSAFTTAPNTIPKTGVNDARLRYEGISDRGILITSDTPIVVYCHDVSSTLYAASVLFPTPTLGKEYTSLNFLQRANFDSAKSYLFVVATEDNTNIEVTLPPGIATTTHAAGTTFTEILNRGQVLNLLGKFINKTSASASINAMDLSGTLVKSLPVNGICKPFAMFCGSTKITIDCNSGGGTSGDNLFQQMIPKQAWGSKFVGIPTVPMSNNYYRVLVSDPATVVKRNGIALTGLTNNYYEYYNGTGTVDIIEANNPILIAQYISTKSQCGNGSIGDPEMVYLSSLQQTIDTITFVSSPLGNATSRAHYLNVAIPASGVASFKIDGVLRSASFFPTPFDPTVYYAQFTGLTQTFHTLTSAVGFNATAYGVAQDESYAYNAGTNLRALVPQYLLQNQYGTGPSPFACRNNEFFLYATLKYKPTKLEWYFFNNPNLSPNTNYTQFNPVASDSFYIDNQKYYVFKNPFTFLYNIIGSFNFQVIATMPIPDGCDDKQVLDYPVNVIEKPTAYFTYPTPLACNTNTLNFTDSSFANGMTLDLWNWSFGDPASGINNTTILENPQHIFTSAGTYPVRLHITTLEGCYDDTTINVVFNPRPAIFNLSSTPVCYSINAQSTSLYYDSTSGAPVSYSITWDSIPSNHFQNVPYTTLPQSPVSISVPDSTAPGIYTGHIKVKDANGCESDSVPFNIRINGLPRFSLTEHNPSCSNLCDGSIDVHIISGTPPYHFTLTADTGTYNISWTSSSDTIIKSLCAGNYYVTVTDSNGCASTQKHHTNNNTNLPCIKIDGILTDAFSEIESDEELIFFSTGKTAISVSDLTVEWPEEKKWLGLCNNPAYIENANKTIGSGGKLIAAMAGDLIPPFSKVVLVSSNNLTKNIVDFSTLNNNLYIIFQCGTKRKDLNYLSDDTNNETPVTLSIKAGEECIDTVKYQPSKLKKK
jgi:hypothetical protein